MKKGPYKVLSTKKIYQNPWIEVREDQVIKSDGKRETFGVVDYGSGVSVVALDDNKQIYLVEEYYYAIDEYAHQIPSGGVDKGETPLEAAKKELLEEAGLTAKRWIELGMTNPLTMIIKSPAYLFLAQDLAVVGKPEAGIKVEKVPFDQAVDMVLKSVINHAPSCVAILKAKSYLEKISAKK